MWVLLLVSTVEANAQIISGKVIDATTKKTTCWSDGFRFE